MNKELKTILVVEDEAAYQTVLRDRLSTEGFHIVSALNGEEGLKKAIEIHPDLIILDLQMPKVGGIAMAKELRKDEWGKNAKIMVLTNFSETVKTEQALEQKVYVYLVKTDIKLEDLVTQIKQLV